MPARQFSDEERENILALAEREGDKRVCSIFDLPEGTLRSWRHRGRRVDRRARDEDTEPAPVPAHRMVDVQIPDGEWNGALGCESKTRARARVLPAFTIGGELISMRPNHHLGVPATDAAGLTAGMIVLLGGEHLKAFSDALWEVVERKGRWRDRWAYTPEQPRPYNAATGTFDGAPTAADPDSLADYALLIVRPARVRSDTRLSEDRSRLVAKGSAKVAAILNAG